MFEIQEVIRPFNGISASNEANTCIILYFNHFFNSNELFKNIFLTAQIILSNLLLIYVYINYFSKE